MPITKNEPGLWIEQALDALLNSGSAPAIADPRRVVHSMPMDYVNQSPIPTVRSPDRSLSMEDAVLLRKQMQNGR